MDGPSSQEARPTQVRRFSPSSLGRYQTCSKAFWFHDIERARVHEQPSPVLVQANAIHHALERVFGLPHDERSAETLHRALRSVWAQHRKRGCFQTTDEEADYGTAALAMLTSFAENFDLNSQPLAREQWVSGRLPNGAELFGKVDRIDSLNDHTLEVVDYKTGRHVIDPHDMPREPAAQVYVLATEATYGRTVERVRFIYLATGDDVRWEPEREDVEAAAEALLELTREIMACGEFPAQPGSQCRWCPFALICPDRQRVALADLRVDEALPF